jgi:AcrR family transcriptional regulator
MAGTRAQFDRNEVINNAIQLFWKNGFSGSSIQQVTERTGLKPGSIYLAFGSKEGLFQNALDSYAQKSIKDIRQVLNNAEDVDAGICLLFEKLIEETMSSEYCSCFLIKTQLELAAEGNLLFRLASEKLKEIEAVYRSYLAKKYDLETSIKRAASIMLHIFGLRVYGYQQDSSRRIRQGLREGLPWLPWENNF